MTLPVPRSVLAALWAHHLGSAPGETHLRAAERAVLDQGQHGPDDGEARVRTRALLEQVAGTAVLALLPVPGDPVRVPEAVLPAAMEAGQALLSGPPAGEPGLLRVAVPSEVEFGSVSEPGELLAWQVHTEPVHGTAWVPPVVSMAEARTALAEALHVAIETLTTMDVARWREDDAQEIAMLAGNRLPDGLLDRLPPGLDTRRAEMLGRAVRLEAIVQLAERDDGAAVNAWQADQRTAALRHVGVAARNALCAVSVSGF